MSDQFIPPSSDEISSDDKLWALLSYIFTPLIPIILLLMEEKKNRKFLKYHAMQALVFGVAGYVISAVLSAFFIGCILGVAMLLYNIYLAVKSYQGEYVKIPVVTDFIKKQGWV